MTTRYPDATWHPTIRHSGVFEPIGVAIHVAQGYISTMERWAELREDGPNVSAHFGIRRDGRVSQFVDLNRTAWHAGRIDSRPPIWPLYREGTNPNTQLVGIEFEGFSVDPGYRYDYLYGLAHPWPRAMLEAGADVVAWCFEHVMPNVRYSEGPSGNDSRAAAYWKQHIIGHSEIAVLSRADDPGDAFPWHDFREMVRSRMNLEALDLVDPPDSPWIVVGDLQVRARASGEGLGGVEIRRGDR